MNAFGRRSAMKEVVIAVYKTASAAETAVEDLRVSRVPSATIRQFVSNPAAQEELVELRDRVMTSGDRVVAVTVDDRDACAVMSILDMQHPVNVTGAA
jgi:hypothetical protein